MERCRETLHGPAMVLTVAPEWFMSLRADEARLFCQLIVIAPALFCYAHSYPSDAT